MLARVPVSSSPVAAYAEDTWSNERLFALAQGLRRLKQIGGDRVRVPDIEWTVN